MRRLIFTTCCAISLAVLASCGQKGPLYLPNNPQAAPPAPETAEVRADSELGQDESEQ